jgi:type IX secretion system PorP/SprF family membrane protein
MRSSKHLTLITLIGLVANSVFGQDPSFSQFFASPLNINPALTGMINGKWRVISNIRDQWAGPAFPYITSTISYDTKILKNKIPESSVFGAGVMLMHDDAMSSVLKSNYASLNLAYNIKVAEGAGDHRLGIGVGLTYASKTVDFSRLNFEHQFNGRGFDTNLPTGEAALSNMVPYFSANAGFLYSYVAQYTDFDFGVAAYHINKPKQTFLEDPNQYLPIRYVVHANYDNFLSDKVVLNTNGIYQFQAQANYFSIGGGLGYFLSEQGEDNLIVNGGVWYWSNNAIVPYVGTVYKNMQFGFTYDITISKLAASAGPPKSFEFSIIIRGDDLPNGVILCPAPWK